MKRLGRVLDALLVPPHISQPTVDAVDHRGQKLKRRRRPARAQEAAYPGAERAFGIAMARRQIRPEVFELVRLEGDGKLKRTILDVEAHRMRAPELDANVRFEHQGVVPTGKARDADTVAERIVGEAQARRLRRDLERRGEQPLVMPLARREHHAMLAERHRLAVAVGGDVADAVDRHSRFSSGSGQRPKSPERRPAGAHKGL